LNSFVAIAGNIANSKKLRTTYSHLTEAMRAAIVLYTMEFAGFKEKSIYWLVNAALRDRSETLERWREYIWLLAQGLKRLTPSPCTRVFRGNHFIS